MLKKRLILCLMMDSQGLFFNSRQFNLQTVGDLEWVKLYLNFNAIDELVILNIDREKKDIQSFSEQVRQLVKTGFIPVATGGGVKTLYDFETLLGCGADKVIINSFAYQTPDFISDAAKHYGSQCVIASIDYKMAADGTRHTYAHNGVFDTGRELSEWVKEVEQKGAGEILLRSIDHDGTGQGYDLEGIERIVDSVSIPVIAAGGVGEFCHLEEGIAICDASAVAAGNIFHHIGDGLSKAKRYLENHGLDVPIWNF
jgi:cyclase